MAAQMKIALTDKEKAVFGAIKTLFSALSQKLEPRAANTVIRVAGGWVRDKIQGNESVDIDIAIDNMFIDMFVCAVRDLKHPLVENVNQNENRELRTVMITLAGEHVEFVNLRTSGFGIPDVPPALRHDLDPWIDAHLRDLTINSLFYNLNEDKIEDWTGRGISDIHEGIIRTPIAPEDTWRADPHRMVRIIRFACKYGYTIDSEIDKALSKPEIRAMLEPIPRERFLSEIEKIIASANVVEGFRLLYKYDLQKNIFDVEKKLPDPWSEEKKHQSLQCLQTGLKHICDADILDGIDRSQYIWSLLLAPFCFSATSNGVDLIPFTKFRMREVWRIPVKIVDTLFVLLGSAIQIAEAVKSWPQFNLVSVGLAIKTLQNRWRASFAIAKTLCECGFIPLPQTESITDAFQRFEQRLAELRQLDLANPIWNWKPVFSSEQLMEMLQIKGKLVGEAITECLCWQIQNAESGWDPDRCREHLVSWKNQKQARK